MLCLSSTLSVRFVRVRNLIRSDQRTREIFEKGLRERDMKLTLRHKIIHHLAKRQPINRIEHKDFTRSQRRPQLIHKFIIPPPRPARCIEPEPVPRADVQDRHAIAQHAALRWPYDISVAGADEDGEAEDKDEQGEEICCPEADVEFEQRGEHRADAAHVDADVEDGEDFLHRQCMTDHFLLPRSRIHRYEVGRESDLFRNKRRDVRFDAARP